MKVVVQSPNCPSTEETREKDFLKGINMLLIYCYFVRLNALLTANSFRGILGCIDFDWLNIAGTLYVNRIQRSYFTHDRC